MPENGAPASMTSAKGRPSTVKAAPGHDEDDDGLLRIGEEEPEEPRYEPRFKIGGKPYGVRVNPSGSLMASYLHRLRVSPNLATSWLLEQMLEPDGYEALMSDPKVSDGDIRKVIGMCAGIVTGNRAAPKSRTAPSRTP